MLSLPHLGHSEEAPPVKLSALLMMALRPHAQRQWCSMLVAQSRPPTPLSSHWHAACLSMTALPTQQRYLADEREQYLRNCAAGSANSLDSKVLHRKFSLFRGCQRLITVQQSTSQKVNRCSVVALSF